MGAGKVMKCAKCAYEWNHLTGFGFKRAIYHCDKCGKQKSVKLDTDNGVNIDLSNEYGSCKCGGTFLANSNVIICPKCHNQIADGGITILWD